MKSKVIMLLCIIVLNIVCFNTFYAVTKEDILNYVDDQKVCGDTSLYNSYKVTFTRLLKQKDLTDEELSNIYGYLTSAIHILNKKNVCKISDTGKLTKEEKQSVINNLYSGADIIIKANKIDYEDSTITENNETKKSEIKKKKKNEGTKLSINPETKEMEIYDDGLLVDKITTTGDKMTYTGPNIIYTIVICISIVLFFLCTFFYLKLRKKHKPKIRCIKNILISIIFCCAFVFIIILFGKNYLNKFGSIISMFQKNETVTESIVKLDDNKNVEIYPAYGSKYAKIKIEKLGINANIYFGDSVDLLDEGIGQATYSNLFGEGDLSICSGHNKKGMLYNLKDIKLNDEIIITTSYAVCTYKVNKIKILNDYEVNELVKINNKETLILYTCYPFDSFIYSSKRFVVYANLENIKYL